MIAIIDYGMGNVGSIYNMCQRLNLPATVTRSDSVIAKASKLILPGVGAFDEAMKNLVRLGLVNVIKEEVCGKAKPILGICLGMQLLGASSEEGSMTGLSLINANTIRLEPGSDQNHLLPHMGWNTARYVRETPLFDSSEGAEARYYFVHSYHVVCDREEDVVGVTEYGQVFCSVLQHENVFGTQFHPEKSHKWGVKIFQRFGNL